MSQWTRLLAVSGIACALLTRTGLAAVAPDALGPWAVGHRQLASADASRSDRPLPLEVWYPVDATDAVGPFTSYTLSGPLSLASTLAREGATVSGVGPRPLVVFSHGSGGIAIQSVHLMEHLASHGFVVVAPNHTGNTNADVTGGTAVPIAQALLDRVPDIRFVIDHMTALAGTPGDPFFGRIDGQNVGVAGHSLGGFTALAVRSGYQGIPPDPRVRAIMPIAPAASFISDAELANITVPTLFMTGTLDGLLAQEIRAAGLIQSGPFNYRADVVGATHTHFANICDIANALIGFGLLPSAWPSIGAGALVGPYNATCIPPAFSIVEATRLQNLYATAHFRRHLLGETAYDRFLVNGYAALREPAIQFHRTDGPFYPVRGQAMVASDPSRTPAGRRVNIAALDRATTQVDPVVGDPTVGGAILRVRVRAWAVEQFFPLEPTGWTPLLGGYRFRYRGASSAVRKAVLARTPTGTRLKVALDGRHGILAIGAPADSQSLPQDGGVELALDGGATYCVAFGGSAGGRISSTAQRFAVQAPTSAGSCPLP